VLSVSVLGSVRVVVDGTPRSIGSRRQRALLAALALRHPRAASVNDLVDALWGDDPPERAPTTLQTYVSRLRGVLGEGAILRDPSGYRLGDDTVVDVEAARRALSDAVVLRPGDPAGSHEVAQAALDMWDGTALAEFSDSEWFTPARVGMQDLRDNLIDAVADGLVGCGRVVEAVELLETVVRTHPFRERGQLLLVRALGESGRSTEALRAADRYRTELRDATGLDPGPALGALENEILDGRLAAARTGGAPTDAEGTAPPARNPVRRARLARPTELVGRAAALVELRRHLQDHRLVTVLGTGGVGKTRLVAEFLSEVAESEAGPVVVELAPTEPAEVLRAIAVAIGYRAGPVDTEAIIDVLGAAPALIVLDNCEHVIDAVRSVVRAVLDACPAVSFITTSRVRLALVDEQILALQPLETSGDHPPAVELFSRCLHRSRPDSDIDVQGPAVLRLCEQLDGIPLALELAAGRAALLGVDALAARLGAAPDVLTILSTDGVRERHASPRAMVSWSHQLLGPLEQRLLAVLSTFESEFDLDAVEQVGGEVLEIPVGPVFTRLIDSSMVGLGSVTGRFRLLQLIRLFAAEALSGTDDEQPARRGHVRWVGSRLGDISSASHGPLEAETTDLIDALRPDIRAAIDQAVTDGDPPGLAAIADGLSGALIYRPDTELNSLVLDAATRTTAHAPETLELAAAGARAGYQLGSLDIARELAEQVLSSTDGHAATGRVRSRAQHALGVVCLYRGRFDEAEKAFGIAADGPTTAAADRCDAVGGAALASCYAGAGDRSATYAALHRTLGEAAGSTTALAFADFIDAERALATGEVDRGTACLQAAAERAWEARAPFVWGIASTVLAATLVRGERHREAAEQLPLLLRRWRRTATWPQLWMSLRLTAEVLSSCAMYAAALTVLAAAEGDPSAPSLADADAQRLGELRTELAVHLGPDQVAVAEARARALGRGQVLDLAIEALEACTRN
jgi:predicted ATPase/DNA-binding SARP family transcriptional activator